MAKSRIQEDYGIIGEVTRSSKDGARAQLPRQLTRHNLPRGGAAFPPTPCSQPRWPTKGAQVMAHRHASVFVVLVLALHSLSTTQSKRSQLPKLPRQLKCEDGACMSGDPDTEHLPTLYNCSKSYTSCDVLKKGELIQAWGFAYGGRILVDLVALANATTHQHGQVLEELEVLRSRLAAAAVLSLTQLAIVVVYLIIAGVLYVKKFVEKDRFAALESNLQEMESRLQERKAKRRAAASKAKGGPLPNQE